MFFPPRGSSLYLVNSKEIFQALIRSYSDLLRWRENSVQHVTQKFQFCQHLALLHLSGYYSLSFQLLAIRLKVYHALSSVFWQTLPRLSQSLFNSSLNSSNHVVNQMMDSNSAVLYQCSNLVQFTSGRTTYTWNAFGFNFPFYISSET